MLYQDHGRQLRCISDNTIKWWNEQQAMYNNKIINLLIAIYNVKKSSAQFPEYILSYIISELQRLSKTCLQSLTLFL